MGVMPVNPPRKTTRQIIKSFEAKALKKRPLSVRIADSLTSRFGSMAFLVANVVVFVGWITINLAYVQGVAPFDPFPFVLLTTAVSLEAIVLTVIVLMSQNRQSYIASLREELDLQVTLMTERELTKALQLLSELHRHHGVKRKEDPELAAMLKETDISYIERKLEEQLQGEPKKTLPQVVAEHAIRYGTGNAR